MRAGPLDERVVIERNDPTKNNLGEEVDAWSFAFNTPDHGVWAERVTQAAMEKFAAAQTIASLDVLFRVRYSPVFDVVSPKHYRLTDSRGRTFNIQGVFTGPDRKDMVYLPCVARGE